MKSLFLNALTTGFVLGILLFASCSQQPVSNGFTEADRSQLIETHNAAVSSAHQDPSHIDWKKMTEMHYAQDAKLLPPNHPEVNGREAIEKFFTTFPVLTEFKTTDVEIDGSGNLAYIRGTFELGMMVNDTTSEHDTGKYIEIWRKDDQGKWLCILDTFNSDLPLN